MRQAIILLTFSALFGQAGAARSDWLGGWRGQLTERGQSPQTVHFFIFSESGEIALEVYDAAGRVLPSELLTLNEVENRLEFRLDVPSRQPRDIQLVLKQTNVSEGKWTEFAGEFVAPLEGSLHAFRVLPGDRRSPWSGLNDESDQGIVDLSSLVAEAPLDNFGVFNRFWLGIQDRYFFVVADWLYGSGANPLGHRRNRLQALLETLQSQDQSGQLRNHHSVLKSIRNLAPADDLVLVSLPAAEAELRELFVPGRAEESSALRRFLYFDPLQFPATAIGQVLAERTGLIRTVWAEDTVKPLRIWTFRHSLALETALHHQEMNWEIPARTLQATRAESARLLQSQDEPRVGPESALARTLSLTLGLALIRNLDRQGGSFQALFAWSDEQIMEAWDVFLHPRSSERRESQ